MENYLSKLFQISPEFRPKNYDYNYRSQYDGQQADGGYYRSDEEPMFQQSPITFEGEGGADKYGKYIGGTVSGYMPFGNGTLSGRVSGNVSKYGKTTGRLSGVGVNYNYGPMTLGADYEDNPEFGGRNYLMRGQFNY